MTQQIPAARRTLIEQVARRARLVRHGTGSTFVDLVRLFYRGVGEEDLAARTPEALARMAGAALALAARRRPREALVHVWNPDAARDGFGEHHTLVFVATDDMPFLVDSLNMAFAAAGSGVHLVVHPVLTVRRDARDRLRAIHDEAPAAGERRESWQLYEIDLLDDAASRDALAERIRATLADVRVAVDDWRAMRARVRALSAGLAAAPPARSSREEVAEARALLDWMEGAHFVFLGYRYHALERGRRHDTLRPDARTGLGILRAAHGDQRPLPNVLSGAMRDTARDHSVMVITKANTVATVHRATHLDYVSVKAFDARGEPCGEHRFLGLWTSTAYFASPTDIPLLRRKVASVVDHFGLDSSSHDGKAILAVLETYPRDELFQASVDELVHIVRGVVNLYERRRTRLLVRRDPFGRFWSCMVYVPRDRYTTDVRHRIEAIVLEGFGGGSIESQVQISESSHARVHVTVRTPAGSQHRPDIDALEKRIETASATWTERLRGALVAARGPGEAARLSRLYAAAFPETYRVETPMPAVLDDLADLESLRVDGAALRLNLHRAPADPASRIRLKFVRAGESISISDLLPVMENFGLRVLSEHPYAVRMPDGSPASIQDFEFELRSGAGVELARVEGRFREAFLAVWHGEVENDGFNRMLLLTTLDVHQIVVLRAICRYLLQTGLPFSQASMERTLAAHPAFATSILQLFELQFDPARGRGRESACVRAEQALRRRLDAVTNADEDRILRAYLSLVRAMLRTNAWQRGPDGARRAALAFKFDPSRIPDLPLPRPRFEIFVYSPRVEGVHLRMGLVARGGLRWSDRRDDFRTEVLGLMKAQNVKNTLIVPVGAKGGFVPRQLPAGGSRDAVQQEGIAAYRIFVGSLLDVTDNYVDGRLVPPRDVVRRDGDDPYLVVAADKGTATFSDIANALSLERGFWLGDAFASGGSAGYDHKKMGITARGAWECVKRHFRELGTDIQSQDFTVAGIGDMSGDVFGNGMLLSEHIRLVAAFNHQHVFLDPAPDAARSFAERTRLFALPRSTWEDYDRRLISKGGGVFPRSAKSIALSPQAQALLQLPAATATPNEVIRAILRMPVDLLWNGGIGTYVKAVSESHADIGDRTNDGLRVNGAELRARVVGEGGNLGFSQLGRVEYALKGGRINTDFIDNSAGVNTSDVEVNLKILMNPMLASRRLRRPDRDALLARMTDEVAALVLRNNYLQSQALSTLESESARRLPELQHFVRSLERSGELNRAIEFLPDEDGFAERRKARLGLTRPELAVTLSYGKIVLYSQLLDSDVPEDPYLSAELERYFPGPVRRRFGRNLGQHRLKREIIATAITNSLVNRMGPSFVMRAQEDTDATPAQIARAYTIVREAFAIRGVWSEIESLDNRVAAAVQYELLNETSRLLRHASYWLLRHRRGALEVDRTVREFAAPLRQLVAEAADRIAGLQRRRYESSRDAWLAAGVPGSLATRVAALEPLDVAFDLAELAQGAGLDVGETASLWFALGEQLGLDWLRSQVDAITVEGPWQAAARTALRENLQRTQRALAARVLGSGRGDVATRLGAWVATRKGALDGWTRTLGDMRNAGLSDFATLSVGVDSVRELLG